MIYVTHLDHTSFVLNSDLIEQIETTPDTVITLTNGHKLTVREAPDEIVRRVLVFRRSISGAQMLPDQANGVTHRPEERKSHG